MAATLCLSPGTRFLELTTTNGRVKFRKRALRTGKWQGPSCPQWDATLEQLERIVRNFSLCKERGIRIPCCYEHTNHGRDKIGDVEDVFLEPEDGETWLVVDFWAGKEEDARHLSLAQPECSVGLDQPWKDGEGNDYDIALTHLAVVNNPVCHGAGEFRRLSLTQPTQRRLAMPDETMPGGNGGEGGSEPAAGDEGEIAVDPKIVDAVAERFGIPKPSGVTVDTLKEFLLWIGEGEADSETPPADEMVDAMPPEQIPMSLKNPVIKRLRTKNGQVQRELSLHQEKTRKASEEDFVHTLNLSISKGQCTEARKQELLQAARDCDFRPSVVRQLSLSVGAEAAPVNGRRNLGLEQGENPLPGDGTNQPGRETCLALAKRMRGN